MSGLHVSTTIEKKKTINPLLLLKLQFARMKKWKVSWFFWQIYQKNTRKPLLQHFSSGLFHVFFIISEMFLRLG